MIKINLLPTEYLVNPLWWVGDIIVAAIISVIAFFGSQLYLTGTKNLIEQSSKEIVSMELQLNNLNKDVKEYDNITKEIESYNSKLASLQRIIPSKTGRYTPLIVLEHIQNLKPYGVWFTQLDIKTTDTSTTSKTNTPNMEKSVYIQGYAIDSTLVAEFITSLKATYYNVFDPQDIRTHIYFYNLKLENITGQNIQISNADSSLNRGYGFILNFNFAERNENSQQIPLAVDNSTEKFLEKTYKQTKIGH